MRIARINQSDRSVASVCPSVIVLSTAECSMRQSVTALERGGGIDGSESTAKKVSPRPNPTTERPRRDDVPLRCSSHNKKNPDVDKCRARARSNNLAYRRDYVILPATDSNSGATSDTTTPVLFMSGNNPDMLITLRFYSVSFCDAISA